VTITWLVRPARFSAAPTARLGLPRRRSSRPSAMGSADGCSVLLWCRASDPPTLGRLGSTRTRHQLLDLGKRCGLGHTAGHTLTRRMLLFRRSLSPWEPWAPLVVLGALGGSSPERIEASCPQVLLFLLACVSISASGAGRLPPVPDAPLFLPADDQKTTQFTRLPTSLVGVLGFDSDKDGRRDPSHALRAGTLSFDRREPLLVRGSRPFLIRPILE